MRKILSLLALMLLCSIGASAQVDWTNQGCLSVSPAMKDGNFVPGTVFYTIQNKALDAGCVRSGNLDENGVLYINSSASTEHEAQWAIVGNNVDGFMFVNRATKTAVSMQPAWTNDNTDANGTNDNAQYLGKLAAVGASNTRFAITKHAVANTANSGYFVIAHNTVNHAYWNNRGNKLGYWYTSNDQGYYGWGKDAQNATGDNGASWKLSATEALYEDGVKFTLKNKGHNVYLGVNSAGTQLSSTSTCADGNIWTLKAVTGGYKLYNESSCKYAGPLSTRNGAVTATDEAGAGVYEFEFSGGYIVLKNESSTTGYKYFHQVDWGGYAVVDWNADADASQWAFCAIEDEETPDSYLVPNGVYEIRNMSTENNGNGRGYIVDYKEYTTGPSIGECTWTQSNMNTLHPANRNDGTNTCSYWYVYNYDDGTCSIFSLSTLADKTNPQFLSVGTAEGNKTNYSNAVTTAVIAESASFSGKFTISNTSSTNVFMSAACGTSSSTGSVKASHSAGDGGVPFVFNAVDVNSLSEAQKAVMDRGIYMIEHPTSGDYTISCTGLTDPAVGGVTYNCVNYTGTLPLSGAIDEDALIAMHVSNYNGTIESIDTENHIINVAYDQEYKATDVLWDGNGDASNTKVPAARIPAMVKAQNGDILAFSDWRYSRDDVGRSTFSLGYQVDIEMRRSSDGGQTWSPAIIVANGDGGNDRTTAGYGDASVVADSESGKVLLMCVNADGSNRYVRYTSDDNGATWSGPVNIASAINSLAPGCAFFTSGKMVQSRDFKKGGATAKRIYAPLCGSNNYVLYSDDFGQNWSCLGSGAAQTGTSNECRLVELPNGDLLLDSRAGTVRKLNVFTYTSREDATGSWGEMNVNGNMPTVDCNGDIDLVTGYAVGTAEPVQILLETMPRGSNNGASRAHVQYYYKVLTDGQYTLNDIKSGWEAGYEVCAGKSAYSSIINLGNGIEAILYEKAHSESETGYNGNPWGYDIKFETHTLLEITNGAYTHEPTLPVTINYTLTDGNGATYTGSYEGIAGIAPTFTGAHGYTLSDEHWGEVVDNTASYTATINFPFPVSSNNVHNWVNLIYLPNYDRYVSYNGTDLKMAQQFKTSAQNDPGDNKNTPNYVWSVTPVLDAATKSFGFKIYNLGANKFVSANGMTHRAAVTLADEGDVFSLIAPTAAPKDATHKDTNKGVFVKSDGSNTFSICIEGAASSDFLTFWNVTTSSHPGQNLDIVAAEDPEVPSDAEVAALQAEIEGLIENHMIGEVGYPTWYCTEVQNLMGGYSINFDGGTKGGKVTAANYNDALEALNAFYSATDVVMPQDGKAYTIANVTPNGSKRMLYYRNDGGMYNNYLRASDNNTNPGYEHTFYCRKVGENKFVFVNEMGIYVEFQRAMEHAAGETYRSNYNDFTFAKMVNDENPRAAFGAFSIYGTLENIGEGYLTAKSGSFNDPSATLLFNDDDAGSTAFVLTEVENPNKVKVSCPNPEGESLLDGKFVGTFSANYNVELRNGLKAYTAALSEDKQTVVFTLLGEDGTIVPKHTGVLVYSENADASITKDAIPAIATVEVNNNIFLATNGGSVTINEGDLVLGNGNKGVGFYLINPAKLTVGRNKAYIPGSAAASVARYMFDFENDGTLTEIEGIEAAPAAGNVFDLQGRRVQNAQKGLYIVGGKKVVR